MQVDILSRKVELSVGELANFRNMAKTGSKGAGNWRAQVGQQWHAESARQTAAAHPGARFEQTLAGTLTHRDWTILLQGRIDQVIPQPDATTLREVKTVRLTLPCPHEDLAAEYPEYFSQAAIYQRLASLSPEYAQQSLRAELLFIEISNGTAQIVPLESESEALVVTQLDRLIAFLDERRDQRIQLNELQVRPAFPSLRPGQAEIFRQLEKASLGKRIVLMQAPTGFGKTGIALEHALRQMKSGLFERCIYLTSKSSGQLETVRQLRTMTGGNLRFIQMRNRVEHSNTGDPRRDKELSEDWFEAGIHPPDLLRGGTLELERAKEIGRETGLCPYALTKACLPYTEVWIGDSNYVFAPQSRNVFFEQYGFDPGKTLLIVDEAHNLPSRNADALSVEIDGSDLYFAIEELREAGATRRLLRSLGKIASEISDYSESKVLTTDEIYAVCDLCEDAVDSRNDSHFDYEAVAPFALDLIWRVPELARCLDQTSGKWLHWCPAAGKFRAQCLDASEWTAQCLKPFSSTILMSATLDPLDRYHTELGITPSDTSLAIGWADWREKAYNVAVDCRVDTRLKHRKRYYETTARTISVMAARPESIPLIVFFPSYRYAEDVAAYLSAVDGSLRISIQPRGVGLAEQEQFIDESLICADVLFLVIGSSYAEGIDKLGGQVNSVIVVGPALPEVTPVQKARMEMDPSLNRETAFREVYLIPAMRRIHQALGRIVRAPGQQARVLLHCQRYALKEYSNLLLEEYSANTVIRKDSDLDNWLESS